MNSSKAWVLAAAAAIVLIAVGGLVTGPSRVGDRSPVEVAVAAPEGGATNLAQAPEMTVYKSPTCGCCKRWIEHMRAAGFAVEAVDVEGEDLTAVKQRYGVVRELSSCHTAIVGDYVIEGHVPAEDVVRLLKERPEISGLTVPGMPVGTPGMEMPGREADRYEVLAFDGQGNTQLYSRH
jgi:hypothetical protein